jgi:hypothetical protein
MLIILIAPLSEQTGEFHLGRKADLAGVELHSAPGIFKSKGLFQPM